MPDEKYEYGIDFDRIAAIDIHTHVEVDGHGHKAYDDELVDAARRRPSKSIRPSQRA